MSDYTGTLQELSRSLVSFTSVDLAKVPFCSSAAVTTSISADSTEMAFTHHTQCRDAALLKSVKYMSETKDTRRDHGPETNTLPSVTSSELSPVSSTIASMSRLKNIAVTKSAPYSLQLSSSIANKAANSLSSTSICPYMVCSSTNYSHDVPTNKSERNESNQNLRRGKWTPEEEEYANAVVREFNSGYLDAEAGTTLRIYLSEKLQCDPMRITKKFTGNDSIGKRVFHPTGRIGDGLTKDARNAQVWYTEWMCSSLRLL